MVCVLCLIGCGPSATRDAEDSGDGAGTGGRTNIEATCPGYTAAELRVIEGDVDVNDQDEFVHMAGVRAVTGYLTIREDFPGSITSLAPLRCLQSAGDGLLGGLSIHDNAELTTLEGLETLTYVGGILGVTENAALTNLTGLQNVTRVEGSVIVSDNAALTSVAGLGSIEYVGVDALIYDNPALSQCLVDDLVAAWLQEDVVQVDILDTTGNLACP